MEQAEICALFTVDVFNEGVDIPPVDTVLFLRPTESATSYLQQLGRGLRLHEGKSCLTVLAARCSLLQSAAARRPCAMSVDDFPDHFSGHAADYARHRPGYPAALFDFVASVTRRRELAWDCATGNGQAAVALAEHLRG